MRGSSQRGGDRAASAEMDPDTEWGSMVNKEIQVSKALRVSRKDSKTQERESTRPQAPVPHSVLASVHHGGLPGVSPLCISKNTTASTLEQTSSLTREHLPQARLGVIYIHKTDVGDVKRALFSKWGDTYFAFCLYKINP